MALTCINGGSECDGCMSPVCYLTPKAVYSCTCCGETLYEGYEYYEVGGEPYCEDCVKPRVAEAE